MCLCIPVILQPGRLRLEDGKVETSGGYIMRPYLKTNKTEKMHVWMGACQEIFRQVDRKGFSSLQESLCSSATLTHMEPLPTLVARARTL